MFFTTEKASAEQYEALHPADSSSDIGEEVQHARHCHCRRRSSRWPWALAVLFFGANLALIAFIALPDLLDTTRSCLRKVSQPSPLTHDLDIEYHVQQFNGSLLKENIYRQAASPEVDAAWEALGVNCKCLLHSRAIRRISPGLIYSLADHIL
jgi:hypothetical protein